MALRPKPRPPGKQRCGCRVCALRSRDLLWDAYRGIVLANYDRDEFKALIRCARAAMLPRDVR